MIGTRETWGDHDNEQNHCSSFAADLCNLAGSLSGNKPTVPTEITIRSESCEITKPFIAVSHVWGFPGEDLDWTQPPVNSQGHPAVKLSTICEHVNILPAISAELKSLVKLEFVRKLLKGKGGRGVWFDMKDIDQHNDAQKHQQVFHLPEVYQSADAVLIIHTCNYTFEQLTGAAKNLDPIGGVSGVLSRSRYHSRLWTYQEALLARERMHLLISDKADIAFLSRTHKTDNVRRTFDAADDALLYDQLSKGTQPLDDALIAQLVKRKSSVAKDLYFGIAPYIKAPKLGEYGDPTPVVLAKWQSFLMSRGLLDTPWAGYDGRYDGRSAKRASWSVTGPMVETSDQELVDAMLFGYNVHASNKQRWGYRGIRKLKPTENGRESAIMSGLSRPILPEVDGPTSTPANITVAIHKLWCEIVYVDPAEYRWVEPAPSDRARFKIFGNICDILYDRTVCDVKALQMRAQLDDSKKDHRGGLLAILLMKRPRMELLSPLAAFHLPYGIFGKGVFIEEIEMV
ncbi:hypothetical protein HK104_003127 [Borealophlyctis nickersoniae]|nr:hypothetical protein HK104_003127 [Borealophlyctis nickersoniae]